jgi:hypothetical protein
MPKVDTRWLKCALGGYKLTEVIKRLIRYSLSESVVAEK